MICKECQDLFYAQAISMGTCYICGKTIVTPHAPAFKVCQECSKKEKLCEQCKKKL